LRSNERGPHENASNESLVGKLGPGLITGAADDDPSGIAAYSQGGAQFGYSLLVWWGGCFRLASETVKMPGWRGHRLHLLSLERQTSIETRRAPPSPTWIFLSTADPLNLIVALCRVRRFPPSPTIASSIAMARPPSADAHLGTSYRGALPGCADAPQPVLSTSPLRAS
jgi:hypothetical protein